jgi:hypothetical protein
MVSSLPWNTEFFGISLAEFFGNPLTFHTKFRGEIRTARTGPLEQDSQSGTDVQDAYRKRSDVSPGRWALSSDWRGTASSSSWSGTAFQKGREILDTRHGVKIPNQQQILVRAHSMSTQ